MRLISRMATALLLLLMFGLSTSGFYLWDGCQSPEEYRPMGHALESWDVMLYFGDRRLTPEWTPDGAHIVVSYDHGVTHVVRSDGSDAWKVSDNVSDYTVDYSPVVSPDGSRITYATTRDPRRSRRGQPYQQDFDIETVALDGTDYKRLTDISPWEVAGRVSHRVRKQRRHHQL